jgi:hypothetical protein
MKLVRRLLRLNDGVQELDLPFKLVDLGVLVSVVLHGSYRLGLLLAAKDSKLAALSNFTSRCLTTS